MSWSDLLTVVGILCSVAALVLGIAEVVLARAERKAEKGGGE